MSQAFSVIVQAANARLNEHCADSGYETFMGYYKALHDSEKRSVQEHRAYIDTIAASTTNDALDHDGSIADRTENGLLIATQFFQTLLSEEEMRVYANRLREDAEWMKRMRTAADLGFLLDRSAPLEYDTLLDPSPWLQDAYGDQDPDFMRGVYYACRLAREAYQTVRIYGMMSPDESTHKDQS